MNAANQPARFGGGVAVRRGSMPNEIRLEVSNPGPFGHQSRQRSHKQRRADDQDQRERNLRRDDRLAKPDAAECGAASLPERRGSATRGRPAGPARGRSGGRRPRSPANANSNSRESTSDCRAVRGGVARQERDQRPHGKRRERHAEQSTGQREQDAVGEKLPSDPPARRAQRQPRADLPIASRSARQEQPGDIQAGQAQQHRRRREQDPERLRQPAPQDGMALRRRRELERRGEKPLPALGRDLRETRAGACPRPASP